jgi:hypothetical protein
VSSVLRNAEPYIEHNPTRVAGAQDGAKLDGTEVNTVRAWLRAQRDRTDHIVSVKEHGARGDGNTDYDYGAIADAAQDARERGAALVFPPGDFRVEPIRPWTGARILGSNSFGVNSAYPAAGNGATILRARTNDVPAVIEIDGDGTEYIKDVEVGGFVILGPQGPNTIAGAGHGIWAHDVLWDGASGLHFHHLTIAGMGGRAIYAPQQWHSLLEMISADNCGDNLFELAGGNTTRLVRCYANRVSSGKCGFRIYEGATLAACNGIDASTNADWGVFGKSIALGDDVDTVPRILLDGCNVEDFTRIGIHMRNGGSLDILGNTPFWAPATGTVRAIVFDGQPLKGNVLGGGVRIGTKGANWTDGQPIHAPYTPYIVKGDHVTEFRNTTFGATANLGNLLVDPTDGSITASPLKIGVRGSRLREAVHKAAGWTPGTIASGSFASVEIPDVPYLAGADPGFGGYVTQAGFTLALPDGCTISGSPISANTVRVVIANHSGGPVTLGAGNAWCVVTWAY